MGCDIHAHYEIKVKGKWIYYGSPDFARNYKFFARLANVRNNDDIKPIDNPRGLPSDISETTKLHNERWGIDGHSHSWITSREFTDLVKEFTAEQLTRNKQWYFEKGDLYLFGNSFEDWIEYKEDYPAFIQDFRLVFWFDN